MADLVTSLTGPAGTASYDGVLVVFEGGEGAGKSTQLRRLAGELQAQGRDVVCTREPGATPVGARIRALLLDPATAGLTARAEALLYAADRAHHVGTVLVPALERGAVVLCDRFVDSSLAYQGAGRDLQQQDVARLSAWATGGLRPDLTVLLDVDPELGLSRAGAPDRIEAESLEFHRRVRAAFLELAQQHPERYLVLAAGEPEQLVHRQVLERVRPLLPAPDRPTTPAPAPA